MSDQISVSGFTKRIAIVIGVLGLAGAPSAARADGGDASQIHACVQKSSQQVRIIGPAELCRNTELAQCTGARPEREHNSQGPGSIGTPR